MDLPNHPSLRSFNFYPSPSTSFFSSSFISFFHFLPIFLSPYLLFCFSNLSLSLLISFSFSIHHSLHLCPFPCFFSLCFPFLFLPSCVPLSLSPPFFPFPLLFPTSGEGKLHIIANFFHLGLISDITLDL